jgi:hypothetical protein
MSTYDSLSQWKLIPISSVSLTFEAGGSHVFDYLVKGSNFSLKPIFASSKSNSAGQVIAGWKFEGTFITSQVNLTDMQPTLEIIAKNRLIALFMILQYDDKMTIGIDYTNPSIVQSLSCYFEINYNEAVAGPELQIKVNGILSKDAIESSIFTDLFKQYWS